MRMTDKVILGEQRIIENSLGGPTDVYTADLDGDGDLDVLSSFYIEGAAGLV